MSLEGIAFSAGTRREEGVVEDASMDDDSIGMQEEAKPTSPPSSGSKKIEDFNRTGRSNGSATTVSVEPASVLAWVERATKVPITSSKDSTKLIDAEMFCDGVIFSKIVQRLDRFATLPGFVASPKSRAQRVQNIRRVFDFLKEHHKRIPLSILSNPEEIADGNLMRTMEVLTAMKKEFAGAKL